ncbi:MAG TPA: hypothetical protein VLM89_02725, partial [Phycisphaerae bacterium]|nr:hypothetical protein [Phycisphaerae bacterium]
MTRMIAWFMAMTAALWCADAGGEQLVASFETPIELQRVDKHNVLIALTNKGVTHGRSALEARFGEGEWPAMVLRQGRAFQDRDWSRFGGIVMDVTNPGDGELHLNLIIEDSGESQGKSRQYNSWTNVQPGRSTLVLYFPMPGLWRMRAGPPLVSSPTTILSRDDTDIDWTNVAALHLTMSGSAQERLLIFDRLRLMPRPDMIGMVDRFGQYSRTVWPGKVKDESDFRRYFDAELVWLAARPLNPDRDEYGGWQTGPKLKATGFFRTAYLRGEREVEPPPAGTAGQGRWSLVTPAGHLFFSLGVNVVNHFERTPTRDREFLFADPPVAGDPLAAFCDQGTVRHYAMNLHRKYGPDWQQRWVDVSLRRLRAWGFNTIGNWSSRDLFAARRVPYTTSVFYPTTGLTMIDTGLRLMPDVFDERFASAVEAAVAEQSAGWRDDPWCLGCFVDNELTWAGWGDSPDEHYLLARSILKTRGSPPARQRMLDELRGRHQDIAELGRAWGVDVSSWDKFAAGDWSWPKQMTDSCRSDLAHITALFAEKYFEVVSQALRKYAPNHLYLGCRFAPKQDEVVRTAAAFCDVISFNIYRPWPTVEEWGFTAALGRPCLITEFHFGALDRGMFHYGLLAAPDQPGRGRSYTQYVETTAGLPAMVGCHW